MTAFTALEPRTHAFSAAVVVDGWVHISGQIGSDSTGRVVGDCGQQTTRCPQKIDDLLAAAQASRSDVVKLNAYLVDAADYALYAEAKAAWVATPAPAGTAVVVAGLLVPGARIEVEALACVRR